MNLDIGMVLHRFKLNNLREEQVSNTRKWKLWTHDDTSKSLEAIGKCGIKYQRMHLQYFALISTEIRNQVQSNTSNFICGLQIYARQARVIRINRLWGQNMDWVITAEPI